MEPGPWWYQRPATVVVTALALCAITAFCALVLVGILSEA